ncbi:MAG TPA: hypothetical protein VMU14_11340 [Acidimicrobiales bacterium]|nr:hypothetical protein [Acidimicrobiales bacterium]
MPLPLPAATEVLLEPPAFDETSAEVRGLAAAIAEGGQLTSLQRALLEAVTRSMTGHAIELGDLPPFDLAAAVRPFAVRNMAFRARLVQVMLLGALVLRPLPEGVVDRVTAVAAELGVDDQLIPVARRFAEGALGLAGVDFERNGYTAEWHPDDARYLHTSAQLQAAWDSAVADAPLAARWKALEELPSGALGRRVTELYRARGFAYPGLPGSAPPLLAQHDWVHVLADYGTTVEAELEVFAFIARANDDMRAFSLLAMVVSLFETGYLRAGAGLFEADTGHLSGNRAVVERMADAMRRGAQCHDGRTGSDSIDFLAVDWFELAHLPLDDARALFSIPAKAPPALEAGSVGPWEAGGISPFQLRSGQDAARAAGTDYDSYGAAVLTP